MTGETNLAALLKAIHPSLNSGDYVFCTVENLAPYDLQDFVMIFREAESFTVILKKEKAENLRLGFSAIFSWITLLVHSSLQAIGLTAAFSKALSLNGISCNVVAAYYHDHIFVEKNDADKAILVLKSLSE